MNLFCVMPSAEAPDEVSGQGSDVGQQVDLLPPALELTTGKPYKAQFTVTVPLPPEAAAIPAKESLYLSELKGRLAAAVYSYLDSKIPTERDENDKITKLYWISGADWGYYGPIQRDPKTRRVVPIADRTWPYTECTVGVRCEIYAHGAEKLDLDINEDGYLQLDWLPVPEYRDIRVTWTGRPAGETVYCLSQIAKGTASQESVRKVLEYNGLTPVRVELVEPPVNDTHTTHVAPSVPQWQVTLPEPTTLREIKPTLENQVQIAYLIPSKNNTYLKLQQTLQTSSYAQALMRTRAPHGPTLDQIFPAHSVKKRKASEDTEAAQPMDSTL